MGRARIAVLVLVMTLLGMLSAQSVMARAVRLDVLTATVTAMSLDCDYRGEPECVNVSVAIEHSPSAAQVCVSIVDNRDVQLFASGCDAIDPENVMIGSGSFELDDTVITASNSADCYFSDPEEGCNPSSLTLDVAAAFRWKEPLKGPTTVEMTRTSPCRSTTRTTTGTLPVTGILSVQGVRYELPGAQPGAHTDFATLEFEMLQTTSTC